MRKGLALRRKLLGNEHPLVVNSLAGLAFALPSQGLYEEGEKTAREALTLSRKVMGDEHPDVAKALGTLAVVLTEAKKFDEAELPAREALAMYRKLRGSGDYETTTHLNKLAMILNAQKRFSEAEELMREALATQRKLLGDRHPELVYSLTLLAGILEDESKLPESELLLREALAIVKKLQGDKYPFVRSSLYNVPSLLSDLGGVLSREGKLDDAEAVFRECVEYLPNLRDCYPPDDPKFANILAEMTSTLLNARKFKAAEPLARECLAIREKKAPNDWRTFNARSMLGGALLGQMSYAEAEPLLLASYEGMVLRKDAIPPVGRPRVKETLQRLVQLYENTGRPKRGIEWKQKLAEFEEQTRSADAR